MTRLFLLAGMLLMPAALLGGCARAAVDTTGYAVVETAEFDAAFMDAWQAVKAELRAMELEIYTRDKRGVFVAYTPQGRAMWLQPRRSKFTVTLEAVSASRTRIDVETIGQLYGVTLLTYPDWHERPAKETDTAQALLAGVAARLGGELPVSESSEQAPEVEESPVDSDELEEVEAEAPGV